jgi:hemerythrin
VPIQWSDVFSIDGGMIDEDHKALISVANEFFETRHRAASLPSVQAILDKFHQYTAAHFQREEALQAKVQYPDRDAHHQEHMELLRQLATIRAQLAQISAQSANQGLKLIEVDVTSIHASLETFLHDMLVDHMIRSDLRMKPYVAKMAQYAGQLAPLDQSVA